MCDDVPNRAVSVTEERWECFLNERTATRPLILRSSRALVAVAIAVAFVAVTRITRLVFRMAADERSLAVAERIAVQQRLEPVRPVGMHWPLLSV